MAETSKPVWSAVSYQLIHKCTWNITALCGSNNNIVRAGNVRLIVNCHLRSSSIGMCARLKIVNPCAGSERAEPGWAWPRRQWALSGQA